MNLKYKFFENVLSQNFSFNVSTYRFFRKSKVTFSEDNLKSIKPKVKMVAIKKKISGNNQSFAIESKPAADVIKRLNWELKQLYGPVLSHKSKTYDQEKDLESQEIIQHETRIPVIDPLVSQDVNKIVKVNMENQNEFNSILSFPLINKLVQSSTIINELNHLRKRLELLTKTSSVPSVSQILQTTMPKERVEILNKWKQNMISQLGKEGFEKYQTELLTNGVSLHHSICSYLTSAPDSDIEIREENMGHWKSLKSVLPNIKGVKLLEEFITHPFLHYRGVVDCFASYKNHLVVIDWKTSKKSKSLIRNTYDDPLQIAAYAGALNFDPKFQYLASKGLIVIAYENGMPATTHFLDDSIMKQYWVEWLMRVKQFWEMKQLELQASS